MSILFSVYLNKHQNVTELSSEIITKSQKVAVQIASKIKNGFISLLNSISNSYASLGKMFSFSNVKENVSSDKKDSVYARVASTIIIEDKKEITLDSESLKSSRQTEFNNLKSEMHAKLNACINNRANI